MVSSTPRPHFTPGKDPVPTLQEAGWVPGPVWTGGKSRPHWDSIPDRPARSQSLYRLSYRAHAPSLINTQKQLRLCRLITVHTVFRSRLRQQFHVGLCRSRTRGINTSVGHKEKLYKRAKVDFSLRVLRVLWCG